LQVEFRVCFGSEYSLPVSHSKGNVRVITLGCAKNDVDSEEIAGVLQEAGYTVDGSADRSEVTVINTCGFLESSKKESIEVIRRAVRDKRLGKTGRVVVAGCLAQRLGSELERLAPGADSYVGVGQMAKFAEIVAGGSDTRSTRLSAPQHLWADVATRARAGAPWSAYLKVSEGCDHRCTFCTIPSFRGPHQSKPVERVLDEAQHLASTGAKEINLIAQDVTQYGYDLYREFTMPRLLRELSAVEGIEWIRLLYCYPNRLTDEVIEAMASLPRVCHYIDVPLQHAHPAILRAMKRPWDGERYLRLFQKLRSAMPDVAIRTTFIVGFPGETEEHFEYLMSFMAEAKLDRVGAFIFSREADTPSYDMPGQVPFRVKRARYDRLMKLQQRISWEVNQSWVGRSIRVLVEEPQLGRSHRDAPEIDGVVHLTAPAEPGRFIEARVSSASEYDLVADP
jgi:ribosomal protein S12 methylthiotransferase